MKYICIALSMNGPVGEVIEMEDGERARLLIKKGILEEHNPEAEAKEAQRLADEAQAKADAEKAEQEAAAKAAEEAQAKADKEAKKAKKK